MLTTPGHRNAGSLMRGSATDRRARLAPTRMGCTDGAQWSPNHLCGEPRVRERLLPVHSRLGENPHYEEPSPRGDRVKNPEEGLKRDAGHHIVV
jgi:hypothetical protein